MKYINKAIGILLFLLSFSSVLQADLMIGDSTEIIFASIDKGREIISAKDDYITRLSPFDRSAKMKTDKLVTEREFRDFLGNNVLLWQTDEIERLTKALNKIIEPVKSLGLPFPSQIYIIKVTGNEEGGAAYTRSNAIMLSPEYYSKDNDVLLHLICHELFHILTRSMPELQEELFSVIGFTKCNEIEFPIELTTRKITNPDAPKNDHYILLQVDGKECMAVPILFSDTENYSLTRGGEFFNYLQFELLQIEQDDNLKTMKPVYDDKKLKFIDMRKATGFFEQIGMNTKYILHPEEILAENFALLVLDKQGLRSPEIINKIKVVLNKYKM